MAVNTYIKGSLVRLNAVFKVSTVPTDPTVVKFYVIQPDTRTAQVYTYGTDPEVIKDSTGTYHMDVSVWNEGTFKYRAEGTGTVRAAGEGSFYVESSPFV